MASSSSVLLLFFLVTFSLVNLLSSTSTFTLPYGIPDNFNCDTQNHEYVTRSPQLQTCTSFNWKGVNGFPGDARPMLLNYFDNDWQNSPLVMTVTLPPATVFENARLQFSVKALSSWFSYNDGMGIFFDDSITTRSFDWNPWEQNGAPAQKVCTCQWFNQFSNLPNGTHYGSYAGQIATITYYFNNDTISGTTTRLVDKIAQMGSFNLLFGDDTSVDYVHFIYDTPNNQTVTIGANVTTYSCRNYTSANGLGVGKNIYSDSTTCKVSNYTDSKMYPFGNCQFIQPHSLDAGSTDSCFQHSISTATRYWLFVPTGLNLSWVQAGGWTPLETGCGVTSNQGVTYNVLTKRYEGGRNVVFGGSCNAKTDNKPMYFIGTAPDTTPATTTSNPAANCLCQSTGDPHFITWDSRKFDFYQPGVFHMVKARDCSFDVQTLTFKYGTTVAVNGIVGIRYFNDTVSLARQNATAGQLWTGLPRVYANGVNITTPPSNPYTVGGLVITKLNTTEWRVDIPAVNFSISAVEAGSWFNLFATLGDLTYQRSVDGLCGNCDSKPANDFKYPDCSNAINITTTAVSASQCAQWGMSWQVATAESFTGTDKNLQSLGSTAYSACKASPLQPVCPDLMLAQTSDVAEPVPPSTFATCTGNTVVTVVNFTVPSAPQVNDSIPCSTSPNFAAMQARCQECFNLTKYDPDQCLVDLCYGPDSVSNYTCPIPHAPCSPGVISSNYTYAGYDWASLGDGTSGSPFGIASDFCLEPFSIPPGWEIAPEGDVTGSVVSSNTWSCHCMTVATGTSYPTAQVTSGNPCFSGNLVQNGNCFIPNRCNSRILIRKPHAPSCGDGITVAPEACDDGNQVSGDGCAANCTVESGWACFNKTPTSTCYLTTPPSNIVAAPPTFTCNLPADKCSACPYSSDLASAMTCCVCNVPCCQM